MNWMPVRSGVRRFPGKMWCPRVDSVRVGRVERERGDVLHLRIAFFGYTLPVFPAVATEIDAFGRACGHNARVRGRYRKRLDSQSSKSCDRLPALPAIPAFIRAGIRGIARVEACVEMSRCIGIDDQGVDSARSRGWKG